MDDEMATIDANSGIEKVKNFLVENKKKIIIVLTIIIFLLISLIAFNELKKRDKVKLATQYNLATIDFNLGKKEEAFNKLYYVVNKKDSTYSPLALYFLIDNNLMENKNEINKLFDQLINKTNLNKEIRNLITYKKALFNSDDIAENELIKILSPITNSESIWKSHSLYLLGEYFYSKNEKKKSKEFFEKILELPNNEQIRIEAQKRLNRDFSE